MLHKISPAIKSRTSCVLEVVVCAGDSPALCVCVCVCVCVCSSSVCERSSFYRCPLWPSVCCVTLQGLRYYSKQRILRMVCIHLLHFSCWVRTYRMEIMREWARETNTSLQANFNIHRCMLSELGPLWHILLMETSQLRCPQPGRLISPWQVSSQKPSLMVCGDSSLFIISKGLSPSPLLILLFPLITGLEKSETNNPIAHASQVWWMC